MLERDGPVPLYVQVADVIQAHIRDGKLRVGDPVPSEAELASEFDIARTTARRVARELREQGVAHTIQGEGTFVGRPGAPHTPSRLPLYQRIAEDIAERIRRGDICPNRAIPGEKVMMQQYGVAKVTARQAVAHLRGQGWVFTVPYRGTYVESKDKWPTTESR
jgi:DNA-binding GntR family transcriptional regulator